MSDAYRAPRLGPLLLTTAVTTLAATDDESLRGLKLEAFLPADDQTKIALKSAEEQRSALAGHSRVPA